MKCAVVEKRWEALTTLWTQPEKTEGLDFGGFSMIWGIFICSYMQLIAGIDLFGGIDPGDLLNSPMGRI